MRRLEKLTTENNKLRRKTKDKKTKGGSSSRDDEDSSLKENVSKKWKKGRNNRDKSSYNLMSFNYDNMASSTAYASIPIGKAPYFDGTCYNQWKHCMKNYLYSISPEVWQVVYDGVEFLDEDGQPTANQLQKIHRNTQTISILILSIDKKGFNRVDDLDVAKDVWNTLWMAHEGSRPIRKAKVEMLKGQLQLFHHVRWWNTSWDVQSAKEASQQGKSSKVQEVGRSHVDAKIDDGLHSNELQCCGLDPSRPRL
jgi:hypothetical protein